MIILYPKGIEVDDATQARTEEFFNKVRKTEYPKVSDEELAGLVLQGICLEARHASNDEAYYAVTPLVDATRHGRIKTVQALIAKGANLEARVRQGKTALMYGWGEGLKVLLAAGAKLEARDEEGQTALDRAANDQATESVSIFLRAGASIKTSYHDGPPLLRMRGLSCPHIFYDLLMARENIEGRRYQHPHKGSTPLCLAAIQTHGGNVRTLLHQGANVYARNEDGVAAIDFDSVKNDKFIKGAYGWAASYENPYTPAIKLYDEFITTRKAPVAAWQVYQLLAVTPLADPHAPVDYVGNLRRIFTHAKWENKEQAENILKVMRQDRAINAETAESILAATFPRERSRRPQPRSVGAAI